MTDSLNLKKVDEPDIQKLHFEIVEHLNDTGWSLGEIIVLFMTWALDTAEAGDVLDAMSPILESMQQYVNNKLDEEDGAGPLELTGKYKPKIP